jgi:hypothetical protein
MSYFYMPYAKEFLHFLIFFNEAKLRTDIKNYREQLNDKTTHCGKT